MISTITWSDCLGSIVEIDIHEIGLAIRLLNTLLRFSLFTVPILLLISSNILQLPELCRYRWIRGGGWYPDRQLRLYKKSLGRWEGAYIHESVKMDSAARVKNLAGDLLHFSVRDVAHHHRMIGERYAPLAAQQMFEEGRRTTPFGIAVAAPSTFIRSFILKGGFRDGLAGLSIARFAAHHAFLKHLMLWEMQGRVNGKP